MRKLTGLDTVPASILAAEVEAPDLRLPDNPPPAGYRLLVLDGALLTKILAGPCTV